jgi:hypothetical protein
MSHFSAQTQVLAEPGGLAGFEPPNGETKIRCSSNQGSEHHPRS